MTNKTVIINGEEVPVIPAKAEEIIKNKLTGQVKKFDVLTKGGKNWYVRTDLKRDYKTDLLIFGKKDGQEYHLAIFENDSKLIKIEEGRIVIPFSLRAILVNHNLVTKENVIKTY